MKKSLYIMIFLSVGAFSVSSCSDWFDISPKTDIKADDLYETENGFLSSLAGIYVLMTGENTYGGNLTFGLVEQLAQMYDVIPDGATDRAAIYNYTQTTSGGYNTKGRMENLWQDAYNIIANANNLIKWLDSNGEDVISDDSLRNTIRGEALAIRAYVHFDLLRLWGPVNYAGNADAQATKSIPYRTVADASKQPLLPAGEVVAKIISDLETAKGLLAREKDIPIGTYNAYGDRRFRFNYHAVNAIMARVYNYAGNHEQAGTLALEVIDKCGLDLQNSNDGDPILFKEVLCGLNLYEMQDNMTDYFDGGDKIVTKYHITYATMNSLFEISGTESSDMRAKTTAFVRNSDQQKAVSRKYIENDNEIIPLVRLPEMYYILCEASEAADAEYYVNTVRNKRGISSANDVSCDTPEATLAALNAEYRKEFYAEGQYFHFLKSHGLTGALVHCPEVSMSEETFVFPLPDREKEYGWTDGNTVNE